MYKLAIYDLDGTIIDSLPDIHKSLIATLNHFNLPTFDIEKTKSLIGDGVETLILKAVGEKHFTENILTYFKTTYENNITNETKIMKDFDKICSRLPEVCETNIILSNKLFDLTEKIVHHFQLDKYFNEWFGGDSFIEKKPSPYPIIHLINKYKVKGNETIVIGDNYTDINAGIYAKAKTCFVTYGYGRIKDKKPHYIANNPHQLLEILKNE
jgi:phosphoglycolate phosphatase